MALLILVEYGCKKFEKLSKQINKFDKLTDKNIEIIKLLKKDIFKIVILKKFIICNKIVTFKKNFK